MELARELYKGGVVRFGDFVLQSGLKSPIYLDMRLVPSDPKLFKRFIELALEELKELDVRCVIGVATGGLVWSSVIAYQKGFPHLYVRSEEKQHGTSNLIEGEVKLGQKAVVVDDVATTGSSIVRAVEICRSKGVIIQHALVLVDREQGAALKLRQIGVTLHKCLTLTQILSDLAQSNTVDQEQVRGVLNWHTSQNK
jgi:orotate phosphoribosyltransferase